MRTKKTTDAVSVVVIAFCFVIAAIILVQVFRTISFSHTNHTLSLDVTRTEIMILANGFNSKTETVYSSPVNGVVSRIKMAGAVVRIGSPILSIVTDTTTTEIQSQTNGVLSYIRDNIEDTFTFENALQKTISMEEILDPPTKFERVEDGKKVKEGDFICKVVNNDNISYVLLVESRFASRLDIGKSYSFTLTYPASLSVNGSISKKEVYNDDYVLVCFTTPYYVETLLNTRKVNGYFSFGFHNAAILPPSAVKEVSPGLYAIYYVPFDSSKPVYAPVTVKGYQPGTNDFIITEIGAGDDAKPVDEYRGIEVYLDWKLVEEELSNNES
ncbi:MAG: HlyD family efflux transporter periplasmic adaptor subunit [Caldisericia bacterium]|nr:HlyD family efflux transporter periplasmic adaptor subunit [Caldisericia bacterium]MDD4615042.1 HlyD family efflux transporter periplasmic adaptor subunit [Caldisericia bacterium]